MALKRTHPKSVLLDIDLSRSFSPSTVHVLPPSTISFLLSSRRRVPRMRRRAQAREREQKSNGISSEATLSCTDAATMTSRISSSCTWILGQAAGRTSQGDGKVEQRYDTEPARSKCKRRSQAGIQAGLPSGYQGMAPPSGVRRPGHGSGGRGRMDETLAARKVGGAGVIRESPSGRPRATSAGEPHAHSAPHRWVRDPRSQRGDASGINAGQSPFAVRALDLMASRSLGKRGVSGRSMSKASTSVAALASSPMTGRFAPFTQRQNGSPFFLIEVGESQLVETRLSSKSWPKIRFRDDFGQFCQGR